MDDSGSRGHDGDAPAALSRYLRRSRNALVRRRLLESAFRFLPWSLAGVGVALAAERIGSGLAPNRAGTALVAGLAGAAAVLAASLVAALARRPSATDVALLLDRRYGTREVVTTATCLSGAPDADAWARRALSVLGGRPPGDAFPARRPRTRTLAGAAGAAGALAILVMAPPPSGTVPPLARPPDVVVVEAVRDLGEGLAELGRQLESRDGADAARDVLADLEEQAQKIAGAAQSKEEALLALERLDQIAGDAQARRMAAESGALQRALSALEQSALSRDAARAAMDGDAERLEQELRRLGDAFRTDSHLDEREIERLGVRLREAAAALREAGSEALARQLDTLAEALEAGDMAGAARLAEELAQSAELAQLMDEMKGDAALGEARELLQQALAAMGRARADAPPEGAEGAVASALPVDWGVGTTNEADPARPLGEAHRSDRQSKETSDWREAYEALHESQRLDGAKGRSTRVHGQVGEGELVAVPSRTTATGPQEPTMPALRIPARYEKAREEALAKDQIPPGYKDPVRRYFTSLGTPRPPEGTGAPPPPAETQEDD